MKALMRAYRHLGVTQHAMHDYTSALHSHQPALAIRIKLFGEEHESTADSYRQLGVTQKKCMTTTQHFNLISVHWLSVLNSLKNNMKAQLTATENSV